MLRHDKALLATVFAQPIMMLLLFGFALSNKPANVPWAVLDQSHSALSRRLGAGDPGDRLLPRRRGRCGVYDEGGSCSQQRRRARVPGHSARTSAATSSAGGRRCSSCSTAAIRCRRRASAATSARSRRRSSRRRAARGAAASRRADAGAPAVRSTCASASGSTRRCATATSSSRRSPACCSPTSACRHQPRPGRGARERHLRADAGAADDADRDRARQARAVRRPQLRACCSSPPSRPARLRHLAAGQLAGAVPRHACRSCSPRWRSACSCRRWRTPRRRRCSSPCSSSCRRSCSPGVMFPYQFMPHGVREIGALFPVALVPDRAAPHHRARRRPRRGGGADPGADRAVRRHPGWRSAGG